MYLLGNLRASLGLLEGCGGTGKTFVALALCLPFLEGLTVEASFAERLRVARDSYFAKLEQNIHNAEQGIEETADDPADAFGADEDAGKKGKQEKKPREQFPGPKKGAPSTKIRASILCVTDRNSKVADLFDRVQSVYHRLPCPFELVVVRLYSKATEARLANKVAGSDLT